MHLVIVISSLRSGGAERVAATLANNLSKEIRVTLLCLSAEEPPFYPLSENVEVRYLNLLAPRQSLLGAVKTNLGRVRQLRRAIRSLSPNVLVSMMLETNILMIMSCMRLNIRLVICEHTDPQVTQHIAPWRWLRKWLYRFSDRLVVLNRSMERWFSEEVESRILVIPNPVQVEVNKKFQSSVPTPYVLAMGRLIPSKAFDKLIELFANLVSEFPEWHLVIAGEGEQRQALQQQIDHLQVGEVVHLIGNTDAPHDWMRNAALFASTSTLEAFPMAICEAMMCSLPVVAIAYNDSARELITPDSARVLDKADSDFANALRELMGDPEKRQIMGQQAARNMEIYGVDNVSEQWMALFRELGAFREAGGN